ncbi:MAG TPA: flagellar hook protein FlgE [Dissulfurispiraceae bacterium]|nr:flagellar hook protein FlgE [Dissulfurispiraceae bacterium]
MSILSSIFTGVSGLNANGQELSVIGDNIANVNTIGFKGSRMAFGDILSQTLTGLSGSSQVGRGVAVNGVTPMFTQGSFQNTNSGLDVAIDGDGFFMVTSGNATYYTRAGNFQVDQNGNVVTPSGDILQGYLANANGIGVSGTIGNVQILATAISQPNATSTANLSVNLDSGATASAAWVSPAGSATAPASTTYNSTTTVTAYDSQGNAHQVNVYFAKSAANTWTAHYVYQDSAGLYQEAGTGQALTFNTSGVLTPASAASSGSLAFNWGGGVANGAITVDLTGTTQVAGSFAVNSITQNGYATGTIKNVLIDDKGMITGVFTNGQTRCLAQLCLAKFAAPTELTKIGNNLYAQSSTSGQPVVGVAQTSGLGRTLSNTLEMSNVDLAEEFTNLISAQRGFQANTKIITTTDDLLNLLISIKQ